MRSPTSRHPLPAGGKFVASAKNESGRARVAGAASRPGVLSAAMSELASSARWQPQKRTPSAAIRVPQLKGRTIHKVARPIDRI